MERGGGSNGGNGSGRGSCSFGCGTRFDSALYLKPLYIIVTSSVPWLQKRKHSGWQRTDSPVVHRSIIFIEDLLQIKIRLGSSLVLGPRIGPGPSLAEDMEAPLGVSKHGGVE